MLKEKRQMFEYLLVAADLLVVSLAWCLAYWARFESGWVPLDKGLPDFTHYLSMLIFVWLIWATVYKRVGLYRPMRGIARAKEFLLLLNANAFSVLLLIAVTYLFREKSIPFSRLVFLYFWIFATFLTMGERGLFRLLLREIRRRGYNLRYMLVVGAGRVATDIIARVRLHKELGIQVIGCLAKEPDQLKSPGGTPIVGRYGHLPEILKHTRIDQLVIALPLEDHHILPAIMEMLKDSVIDVKIVPDLYQFVSVGGSLEEFEGLPVISVQSCPLDGPSLMLKRVLDIIISSLGLFVLSPLLVVIALLVKLTSRGPIFYVQERVSYDGSKFNIIKFRTMRTDAEATGPQWSQRADNRVTAIGRILRVTSIDELPQLWNVLRGDMSIVGPRPERPIFIEQFRQRVPRYMLRHKVPAGITGWAQIHGWRGDTSIDKRIEYDLYYIENWSLFLDIKILLLTVIRGFVNRSA